MSRISSLDLPSPLITSNYVSSQNVHINSQSSYSESMVPSTPNIDSHNHSSDQNVPSTPLTQEVKLQRNPCLPRSSTLISSARLHSSPSPSYGPSSPCTLDQLVPTTPQGLLQSTKRQGVTFDDHLSISSSPPKRAIDLDLFGSSYNLSTSSRQALTVPRRLSLNKNRMVQQNNAQKNEALEVDDDAFDLEVNEATTDSPNVPGILSSSNSNSAIRMLNRSTEYGPSSSGNGSSSLLLTTRGIKSPPISNVMSVSHNSQTHLSSDLNFSLSREKITIMRRNILVKRTLESQSCPYQNVSHLDGRKMQLFEDSEIFI